MILLLYDIITKGYNYYVILLLDDIITMWYYY